MSYHFVSILNLSMEAQLIFLLVKYVPAWFPGAGFQKELSHLAKQVVTMLNLPVSLVKETLVSKELGQPVY